MEVNASCASRKLYYNYPMIVYQQYIPPIIEVIEIKVEYGFNGSENKLPGREPVFG